MTDDRRFSEVEVGEILRRATEPRTTGDLTRTRPGRGLTLEEVQEIAAEAAIDPDRVGEAARALSRTVPSSRLDAFVGSPTSVRFEIEHDGDLDEDGRTELVRLIRASLGRQGVVGGRGADLEWMDQDGYGSRNVNVYRTAAGTRVEMLGSFREAGAGAAGVAGVTGVVGAIAVSAAVPAGPAGLLLVPVAMAAMYAVPRLTIGAAVRRETRALAELRDRIRDLLNAREARSESGRQIETEDG
jgi:hypothetical protein